MFFLFLWVLRCFTSPGMLYTPMYSVYSNSTFIELSFLIRTSTDQRLLGTFPWLFAPCNVLLRYNTVKASTIRSCVYYENTKLYFRLFYILYKIDVLLTFVGWYVNCNGQYSSTVSLSASKQSHDFPKCFWTIVYLFHEKNRVVAAYGSHV